MCLREIGDEEWKGFYIIYIDFCDCSPKLCACDRHPFFTEKACG